MDYISRFPSPLGTLTLASDGESITGLWIEGQKYFAASLGETQEKDLPAFGRARDWLECYFRGEEPDFTPPLAPRGSDFRQAVWRILRAIPYGSLVTYKSIAQELERKTGKKTCAQAVGGAVGHNPVSIIIPCHRVVGTDGSLTGYAGGVDKKIALLTLEKTNMDGLFVSSGGSAL